MESDYEHEMLSLVPPSTMVVLSSEDEETLEMFAFRMYNKLALNKWKRHWSGLDNNELFRQLVHEVRELRLALDDGSDIEDECADIANYCMMIASNMNREKISLKLRPSDNPQRA